MHAGQDECTVEQETKSLDRAVVSGLAHCWELVRSRGSCRGRGDWRRAACLRSYTGEGKGERSKGVELGVGRGSAGNWCRRGFAGPGRTRELPRLSLCARL